MKVFESVSELIGEIPEIDMEDQKVLRWAIENNAITNEFPLADEMLTQLDSVDSIDSPEDTFDGATDSDMGIQVNYLRGVLLPKAQKLFTSRHRNAYERKEYPICLCNECGKTFRAITEACVHCKSKDLEIMALNEDVCPACGGSFFYEEEDFPEGACAECGYTGDQDPEDFNDSDEIIEEPDHAAGLDESVDDNKDYYYECYNCGKPLDFNEVIAGQKALNKADKDYSFEGWVNCSGPDNVFINSNDKKLLKELNELPGHQGYEASIAVCTDCVNAEYTHQTGKTLSENKLNEFDNEDEKQIRVVASGIEDRQDAEQIARTKHGQVIQDDNDEKKFSVVVSERKLNENYEDEFSGEVELSLYIRGLDDDVDYSGPKKVDVRFRMEVDYRSWGIKDIDVSLTGPIEFSVEIWHDEDELNAKELNISIPAENVKIGWTKGYHYLLDDLDVEIDGKSGEVTNAELTFNYIEK